MISITVNSNGGPCIPSTPAAPLDMHRTHHLAASGRCEAGQCSHSAPDSRPAGSPALAHQQMWSRLFHRGFVCCSASPSPVHALKSARSRLVRVQCRRIDSCRNVHNSNRSGRRCPLCVVWERAAYIRPARRGFLKTRPAFFPSFPKPVFPSHQLCVLFSGSLLQVSRPSTRSEGRGEADVQPPRRSHGPSLVA